MRKVGRPSILNDRIPTVINIERFDLVELRNKKIDLPALVRGSIKKALESSPSSRDKLKSDIEDNLNNVTEEYNKALQTRFKINALEESGEYTIEIIEPLRTDNERCISAFESQIEHLKELLGHNIFKICDSTAKPCIYGRSTNVPLNSKNFGTVFHHMHLNLRGGTHRNIGIYIPKELHRSIKHSSISGDGMKEINKASLLWLCEQSII